MSKESGVEARKAVVRALLEGRSFVLPVHIDPDGDSLGSSLALAEALRILQKEAVVVSRSTMPELYSFLPGAETVIPIEEWVPAQDTVVLVDTGDLSRAGLKPSQVEGMKVVNIDHHASNRGYGDVAYVDAAACAAGEMVLWVLEDLGVSISSPMAELLYVAIMTDTGCFRFGNTTESCFESAAKLVALGASPHWAATEVFEKRRLASVLLMGLALSGLKISEDGRVCWVKVSRDMMEQTGASEEDINGLVNYTRIVRGVEVGALFKQMDDGSTRVALRSNNYVDVARLATRYGGGGHARAAGFSFPGGLDDAERKVTEEAKRAVEQSV